MTLFTRRARNGGWLALGVSATLAVELILVQSVNVEAAVGVFTEYPVPTASSHPISIAAGPDGNLWFTERNGNKVAMVTASGVFTEYPVPTANGGPWGIAAGADGNLWFTEANANKVARVTTSGVFTEYPIPDANGYSGDIVAGPDGNLWFTEGNANKVGKVTTSGVFTEYPIPTANSGPERIAAGPDGNLWFTEFDGGKVAKVTTSGVFTEYPIPTVNSHPEGIAAGPDGNLWFTENYGNKVAKVTTSGVFTEYPIPTAASGPAGIAAGADGNLWFTEYYGNKVAKVTTSGVLTEYPIPTAVGGPNRIAAGPDGNLWFTEFDGNKVAMVMTGLPGSPTSVYAVAGNQQATISWTAPSNTGGSAITSYRITPYIGSSAQTPIPTGSPATTFPVTGLSNGTAYTFTVAAINSVGTGPPSAPSNLVGVGAVASLPAMANAAYGGYTTRTYIQNRGSAPARVSIVYRDSLGQTVGVGDSDASLPVNALWEVRQNNGNGLAIGQAGSAVIFSDQPLASFVNEFAPGASDATSYTGVQIGPGTGSSLFAPTIAKNAYGGYTTGIGLINQSAGPTDVTITYRSGDGTIAGTPQVLTGVAAGAYQGVYTGDVASLPAGFAGSATITSSNGAQLAAIVNETGPGGQFSSYDTVPSGSASLFAPTMLRNAYGGYNTGMAIVETAGVSGTVSITYYDSQGIAYPHPNIPIAAQGFLGVYQGAGLLAPPSDGAYTASITTGGGAVVAAIVNEVAAGGTMSTSYNTFGAGTSTVNLPLVANAGADGITTSVGIMNTGSITTTVTLSYFDPTTGGPVGTPQTVTLLPGATAAIYQGDSNNGLAAGVRAAARLTASGGGLIAVICNEVGSGIFMSYIGR